MNKNSQRESTEPIGGGFWAFRARLTFLWSGEVILSEHGLFA